MSSRQEVIERKRRKAAEKRAAEKKAAEAQVQPTLD